MGKRKKHEERTNDAKEEKTEKKTETNKIQDRQSASENLDRHTN